MTPDRIARVAAALGDALGGGDRLGIAVSGGADSLALLLLAHAAMPGRIEAATVHHGLRAAATEEAAMVAALCARLGVPHEILAPAQPLDRCAGNMQARARSARYDALARWAGKRGLAAVATAHHIDDQAETLLMRAARGAGVAGLSGVRSDGIWSSGDGRLRLLRPLLDWRRHELATIAAAAGLTPVDDPANSDSAHDRTRFRALLASTPDLDPAGLARSAATLADAREALDWSVARLADTRLTISDGGASLDPSGLPREYRRRLVAEVLARLGAAEARGPALGRLLATLETGGTATLGGVQAEGGATWRFSPAPARRGH